jgi:hypothetical protein
MRDEGNKAGEVFAELDDPNLRDALRDFRSSVHTWSDATYSAARTAQAPRAIAWRRTLAWALSLAISAGALSGAVYERHHQQMLADQQHQRELQLEHQQQVAAQQQHARESEDLLAKIDSDVAREVPSAMEPLAQMMTDDSGVR